MISPSGGTVTSAALAVTIEWSDYGSGLSAGTRSIVLNGFNVTSSFSYSGSSQAATSADTVTLVSGSNTLQASICDLLSNCSTNSRSWTFTAPPAVRVTPEAAAVSMPAGSPQVARFRVVNTGASPTTYTLTTPCSGVGTCVASAATVALTGGDSVYVDVSYQTPASGTGQASLRATAGSAVSTGTVTVTAVVGTVTTGFPGDAESLMRIERGGCVVMSIGPAASYECGDLRVAHGLPAVRELNRARGPVLTYNSQHAQPYPVVAAQVTPRAGTAPDSIRATVTVGGVPSTSRWAAWPAGTVRQVAVAVNGSGLPTGLHAYTLEVRAHWNSGSSEVLSTRSGRMIVVNRQASPFGAGWWLAGLEELHHVGGDSLKLWVGGDGSARLYRGGGAAGPWVAGNFTRPDTLRKVGAEYVRTLPGRAEVRFDEAGRHIRTVSRLGHATVFRWAGGRLVQLNLPLVPAAGDTTRYRFEYGNNTNTPHPRLSLVRAPGTAGFRDTGIQTDDHARVTRITDPDLRWVGYGYFPGAAQPLQMASRQGRGYAIQNFHYKTYRLKDTEQFPSATDSVRIQFWPAETLGVVAATATNMIRTRVDGPRGNVTVGGHTMPQRLFWWVNRWGAPTRILAPGLKSWEETLVTRGDPRWPALVTRVVAPNGFTTTASYDGRGNVASQTRWNPLGDGRNATTTYTWNTLWDAVERVTSPDGSVALTQYDSVGRPLWTQAGPTSATRVHYGYHPKTHTSAPGLAERVTLPGGAFERYEYDVRGNLRATVSPTSLRTEYYADAIGRDTLVTSPISGSIRRRDRRAYDLMGRDTLSESISPAMYGMPEERVLVKTLYDFEGNRTWLYRSTTPDTAKIGVVMQSWLYDPLGRMTVEFSSDYIAKPDSLFYDRSGNVIRRRTRRQHVIQMEYDAQNRLVTRTTPAVAYSRRTATVFNPWDANQAIASWWFPFYPNGSDSSYVIPADTARFSYDASGSLARAENRDGIVTRSYYPNGALKTDTLRVRTWAEVAAGGGFTHAYGLGYEYDLSGRRTALLHPGSIAPKNGTTNVVYARQEYGYDPTTGGLARVRDVLGNEFRWVYDVLGRPDSIYRPGGIAEDLTYDDEGRLIRHTMLGDNFLPGTAGADTMHDITYHHDSRGKVIYVEDQSVDVGSRGSAELTYSPAGTLRYMHSMFGKPQVSGGGVFHEDIISDALGHRVSHRMDPAGYPALSTFQAGTGRLLTSEPPPNVVFEPGASPTTTHNFYDAAGNVQESSTFKPIGEFAALNLNYYGADDVLRLSERRVCDGYKYEDQGAGCKGAGVVSPANAGTFEEYRYDPLGRRILVRSRVDQSWCNHSACSSTITRFVWDGDQILYEIRSDGNNGAYPSVLENDAATGAHYGRVAYTHGPGIDQPLNLIRIGYTPPYEVIGSAAGFHEWGGPYPIFPHQDWRGSFAGGTTVTGERLPCSTPGSTCTLVQWPAQNFAAFFSPMESVSRQTWFGSLIQSMADESGLMYRRNRYYDPNTGAFTQEDPIGIAGGLNLYGFGGGDPVTYSDPYGLSASCCIGQPSPKRSPEDPETDRRTSGALAHGAAFGGIGQAAKEWWAEHKGDVIVVAGQLLSRGMGGAGAVAPRSGTGFVVTPAGQAIRIPAGAAGPTPTRAPGVQYTGGSGGGHGLDSKVTGVRIMEGTAQHSPRVSYMNTQGQTVSPSTGQTVPKSHPHAHIPLP